MKAKKTFIIGAAVFLLSLVQYITTLSPHRLIGIGLGLFCMIWGWKIGWTRNRNLTALVGHIAVAAGCLVIAYSVYQIPFMESAPGILEVIDLPLFWGLFSLFGGICMIRHSYCNCVIRMHDKNNKIS